MRHAHVVMTLAPLPFMVDGRLPLLEFYEPSRSPIRKP